jgi:hypothetical protein
MSVQDVDEIYEKYVRPLSPADRLRLLERTARDLAETSPVEGGMHSILELRGLGKEIWEGVDPQRYVSDLRDEWDRGT